MTPIEAIRRRWRELLWRLSGQPSGDEIIAKVSATTDAELRGRNRYLEAEVERLRAEVERRRVFLDVALAQRDRQRAENERLNGTIRDLMGKIRP